MPLTSTRPCPQCGDFLELTLNARAADRHYYCRACDAHYVAVRTWEPRFHHGVADLSHIPEDEQRNGPPVGARMTTWVDE